VAGLRPGGQDDVPGEEFSDQIDAGDLTALTQRTRPLIQLLNTPATDLPWTARYRLRVRETVDGSHNQSINFSILASKLSDLPPRTDAIGYDFEPFAVWRISAPPLVPVDADSSAEVANWTSGTETWNIASNDLGFDLYLPPQGIGEDMHRRIEDDDVAPGRPLRFRYSPPSRLGLLQSRTARRFQEPGWNLRRLLEAVDGVSLRDADFELFYGMAAKLKPADLSLRTQYRRIPCPHR
jgi:hypothetical protein